MTLKKTLLSTAILAATLGLTACGGSSSNDNNDTETPTPVNAAPTDISLSAMTVADDVLAAEVGTLSASDDTDSGLTFALSDDEDRFEITNGTTLKLKEGIALNFEQEAQVAVTVTVTDAGGLTFTKELDVSVDDIEAVDGENVYEFASKLGDGSSVSYKGQIARHALSAEIKNYVGQLTAEYVTNNSLTGESVKAQLMALWGDYEAVKDNTMSFVPADSEQKSFADISSSGKELSGKVAGEDAAKMYKEWLTEGTFIGWTEFGEQAKTPEGLVFHYFDLLAANIEKHNSGEVLADPAGNAITNLYVTAEGLDLNQLIQKHTLGAVMFSQGTDDYLEQGLESDNTTSQKEDGLYTALEHQFDEGFGYFGAARNYLEYSDDEIAAKGGRDEFKLGYNDYSSNGEIDLAAEYNWGNSTNAAKRDRGAEVRTDFTAAAMNAFISGRKLISEAVGTDLTDEQMTELKGYRDEAVANWEYAIAATVVHYINDTIADLETISAGDYSADDFATLAKHYGEMKGFALNFQFSPFTPFNEDDNADKFSKLHTLFADAPVLSDADAVADYIANLEEARELMQQVYGFNAENVSNW